MEKLRIGHPAYTGLNALFTGTEQEVYKELLSRGVSDKTAVSSIRRAVDKKESFCINLPALNVIEISCG